jgi:hypothetical protein
MEGAMLEASFLSLAGIGLVALGLLVDVRAKLIKVLAKLESQGSAGK